MTITFQTFEAAARTGQVAECRAFLATVHSESGSSAEYMHALAVLHARVGEFARAFEVCQEIGLRWPAFPNHRYLFGACAAHLGWVAPVLQLADRLAGFRQDFWEAAQLRAELWHLVGCDERLVEQPAHSPLQSHPGAVARFLRSEAIMRLFGIPAGLQEYTEVWCQPKGIQLLYRMTEPGPYVDFWHPGRPLPATLRMKRRGGLGDYLMWERYVPLLEAAGVRVVGEDDPAPATHLRALPPVSADAWVRARLADMLQGREPSDENLWTDPFTLFAALFPLVGHFSPMPAYLAAPADAAVQELASSIRSRAGSKRCVGVFWSACESESMTFGAKSLTVQEMLPLLQMTDVHWVILQRGYERDLWLAREESALTTIVDASLSLDQTAALVASLDAVVSMDSALAHLAAALGVPTLVPLSAAADWRWEQLPDTTPWYASMKLVRQPVLGAWHEVVQDTRRQLVNG